MSQQLNTWQVNMLITGKALATELPAASPSCRAFVYIYGYSSNPARHGRPSKFINADHSDVRFRLRIFEVGEADMSAIVANGYESDYYERDVLYQNGIASLQDLETILRTTVDDFSALTNSVKIAYPF